MRANDPIINECTRSHYLAPMHSCRPQGMMLRKVRSLPFRPCFSWLDETDSERSRRLEGVRNTNDETKEMPPLDHISYV